MIASLPNTAKAVDLAPSAFLSKAELLAYQVLQDAYHLPLQDEAIRFGGLSPREWLRGYSVLKDWYACDSAGEPILRTVSVDRDDLNNSLTMAGLTPQVRRWSDCAASKQRSVWFPTD